MRWMILGGAGVFGNHLAKFLLEKPEVERVVCIGRNPRAEKPWTLGVGDKDLRYRYEQCHVAYETDRLFDLMNEERPNFIVNFAAQGESAASWTDSWRYFDVNATGLARIVERLIKLSGYPPRLSWSPRWIQIGTSELYGSCPQAATEEFPIVPTSPYAASKAAADMYLMAVNKTKDFPATILRPSNAYGPGQKLHRIIPRAVVCALRGEKLPLQGSGMAKKSYIHADDLSSAIWLASKDAYCIGKIYNVGPPQPITIRSVVERVAWQCNMTLDQLCDMTPPRPGEDSQYWLNSELFVNRTNWRPMVDIGDGIAGMIEWGRKYLDQLPPIKQTNFVLRA